MRTPAIACPTAGGRSVGESPRERRPWLTEIDAIGLLALAMLGSFLVACNKNSDGPRPAQITAAPGAPVQPPAPAPAPGSAPAATGAGPSASASITGKITLASQRKGDVTPSDAVYLVARRISDNPSARGSLVAVKRFSASSFPIDFTLGAGDMMFKNGAFEGTLTLAARVDKDGDPMTRRKGDVFGTLDRVQVGAAGVEIKLDQLQKEDESLAGGAPPMQGGLPPGHP